MYPMYTINTEFCRFHIVPLKYVYKNGYTSIHHIYDVTRHTERLIRLLIWNDVKEITVHTDTYENKEGWAYSLILLFNGVYAVEFTPRCDFKDKYDI
jgi:hypothetical protein